MKIDTHSYGQYKNFRATFVSLNQSSTNSIEKMKVYSNGINKFKNYICACAFLYGAGVNLLQI